MIDHANDTTVFVTSILLMEPKGGMASHTLHYAKVSCYEDAIVSAVKEAKISKPHMEISDVICMDINTGDSLNLTPVGIERMVLAHGSALPGRGGTPSQKRGQ